MSPHPPDDRDPGMIAALPCPPRRLPSLLALTAGLVIGAAGPAEAAKNWAVEYDSSVEGTNNLEQRAAGNPDLTWRNSVEFSYFPAADADNSALFRLQALNQRYLYNPDFNSTYLIGTALASRRVVQSLFGYGGYQLLYKQADSAGGVSRQDNDVFGGMVQYLPISSSQLVFHGYQFDVLRAAVRETSYQGHSLYVTYRNLTTDRWTNSVGARSQLRLFDTIGQIEWRNQLTAETDYHLFDWWALEGEVILINSTTTIPGFAFNGWNVALFSRFAL
ncbi:MAG: hypothetical protein JWM80_3162 [Cyanobacteria bacterium RYN_339]|nr:hypothetical protein [Cyanobacteria bacterium RYN_339]